MAAWLGAPIGIPYVDVPGSQPRSRSCLPSLATRATRPYPVPTDAPIEAGGQRRRSSRTGVERDGCILYELYYAYPQPTAVGRLARAQCLTCVERLRPDGWTSADAAGLPILAGLVLTTSGQREIRHALRFTRRRRGESTPGRPALCST